MVMNDQRTIQLVDCEPPDYTETSEEFEERIISQINDRMRVLALRD
jgi:hypothetical protein